jgi:HD-like signal output (HDOD) protein
MRRFNVEEAFLSGLLHDVGRPVLLQAIVDLHKELRLPENTAAIEAAAREHHAPVGSALVAKWSLPAALADTIRFHHMPGEAPSDPKGPMMASLSDELSHHVLDGEARDEAALRSHRALDVLNLYPDDVDKLLAMRERIVEMVTAIA